MYQTISDGKLSTYSFNTSDARSLHDTFMNVNRSHFFSLSLFIPILIVNLLLYFINKPLFSISVLVTTIYIYKVIKLSILFRNLSNKYNQYIKENKITINTVPL
jgi:membrane protein YdbS with pleckstrin-like domain